MRFTVLVLLLVALPGNANFLELRRNANVYLESNTGSQQIGRLEFDGSLQIIRLQSDRRENGFHHIQLPESGRPGWVHKSRTRLRPGNPPDEIPGSCDDHLVHGTPSASDQLLCRDGYALGYNFSRRSADWVAYRLTPGIHDDGNVDRQDDFREDEDLPFEFRTTPNDYEEPVFDQGHLAPSESLDDTIAMNSQTFLMSNMTPQRPRFNRNGWRGLENRERKWASARGEVFVYIGPIYEGQVEFIGDRVPVPSHFFKVVYDPEENEAIAFLIPHQDFLTAELNDFLVSVDEVEQRSGLNLLSALPNATENAVESTVQPAQWP